MEVAPLVGAWIEINYYVNLYIQDKSLLSWERGLKYNRGFDCRKTENVAPLVGAWIEI